MSDSPAALSPELCEVLIDVARDPRSTLLRTPSAAVECSPRDVPILSARTPGWTSAERHLLQAYREEVGLLLRNAIRTGILSSPRGSLLFFHASRRSDHEACETPDDISRSAWILARMRHSRELNFDESAWIAALAAGEETWLPRLSSVAASALRIQATDTTRVLTGAALILESKLSAAHRFLSGVTRGSGGAWIESMAWSNLGLVASLRSNRPCAMHAYAQASCLSPANEVFALNCLVQAILLADLPLARLAASRVDELVLESSPNLKRYEQQRRLSGFPVPSRTRKIARTIADSGDHAARAIANVLYRELGRVQELFAGGVAGLPADRRKRARRMLRLAT